MIRIALVLLTFAFLFPNKSTTIAQQPDKGDVDPKYQMHEWGVFTVPRDADWLKQDMLREWQSFPTFFHGTLPKRSLAYRGPVTKPVMYFHSDEEFSLNLYIHFADGQPLIWWPPAEHPATGAFGRPVPEKFKSIHEDSYLRFVLSVNNTTGKQMPVAADHWVNDLRKVDSAPLFVRGSYSMMGVEEFNEGFVYYDGLMKPPKPPQLERSVEGIKIKTDSDFDWLDVMVVERSYDGETIRIATADKIGAGVHSTSFKLVEVDSRQFNDSIAMFRQRLIKAGLNLDEAQSLIDVWRPGLFERPGISIIHRIPQKTYDKWIPLHLNPKPENMIRVGLVVHQNLEPELNEEITKLIGQLGSKVYKVREKAQRDLHAIGGAAMKSIKAAAKHDDPEIADRANRLIKQLDVEKLLDTAMKRFQNNSAADRK